MPKPLWQREHACTGCGVTLHRDVNSAPEIPRRGLESSSEGVLSLEELNVGGCGERAPGTLIPA